jgi:hypothetical protein
MEVESKLVPILREGIEIVKMIFFKQLQTHLVEKFPESEKTFINKLAGAVINQYFGIVHQDKVFVQFAADHQDAVDEVLREVPLVLENMRIPLTDSLRIMTLCDFQEGVGDSSHLLERAKDYGILLVDREIAMPNKFIELIRKLGESFGFLTPPIPAD